jgi:hypothetical protein
MEMTSLQLNRGEAGMERGEAGGLGWVFGGVGVYIAAIGIAGAITSYATLPPAPRPVVVQTPVVVQSTAKRCEMRVSGDGIWIEFTGKWTEREELVALQAFRERVNSERQYAGAASVPWQ